MTGRNRVKHFRHAQASAAEACAVLDLVAIDGSHAILADAMSVFLRGLLDVPHRFSPSKPQPIANDDTPPDEER